MFIGCYLRKEIDGEGFLLRPPPAPTAAEHTIPNTPLVH
jgi:hypothetical protein